MTSRSIARAGLSRGLALALALAPLSLAPTVFAADPPGEPPLARGVGERVEDFTLTDAVSGRPVSLYEFRGKKAGVIVFTGTDCPVGDLYMPRLVELAKAYEPKGVVFLAINANDSEPADAVAAHAKRFGLTIPVLKDPGHAVADALQARRTCEALVLDGRATIRYRGAIDDQYGYGTRKAEAKNQFLTAALDAVIEGREVSTAATSVVGCPIEGLPVDTLAGKLTRLQRVRPVSEEQARLRDEEEGATPDVGAVTYADNVAAVLQAKCQNCHRPGQVAPFSLLTYDDAKRWAGSILEVVDDRRMPPWHADPRYGHFANDRRLTATERATLLAWVDQGSPPGDLAKAPAPRAFPEGWSIGTPDIIFELPEPYTIKPEGFLNYQRFRVPTNFKEDVWVQAAEARPTDRSVVHHIIVYVLPDPSQPFMRMHLCGYAPGDMPSTYPQGVAKRIPAGSVLEFEMHYTPIGRVKVDRSSVGLVLAKEMPEREAFTRPIAFDRFRIPPGAEAHEVKADWNVKSDTKLLAFMPHMHLRGKDFLYRAYFPDRPTEPVTLLSVPAYDFGWQSYYTLKEPLLLPAGTRVECIAHFDNSESNPANPDPKATVTWGDQTYQEMMIGYVDVVPDRPIQKPEPRVDTPTPGQAAGGAGAGAGAARSGSTSTSTLGRVGRMILRRAGAAPAPPPATASRPSDGR
jgi:peroxiredoxin